MLKAKSQTRVNKNKLYAMKELSKEECTGIYIHPVPIRLAKKFKMYLTKEEMTLAEWLNEKIEEL